MPLLIQLLQRPVKTTQIQSIGAAQMIAGCIRWRVQCVTGRIKEEFVFLVLAPGAVFALSVFREPEEAGGFRSGKSYGPHITEGYYGVVDRGPLDRRVQIAGLEMEPAGLTRPSEQDNAVGSCKRQRHLAGTKAGKTK